MQFELNTLSNYTNEALIEELKRVSNIIGSLKLSHKNFNKHSKVHSTTILKRFGSWENALREAELEHKLSKASCTIKRTNHLSQDEVIKELKHIANKLNTKVLRKEDINNNSNLITAHTLNTKFGSMENGLNAAGLQKSKTGVRYTDEQCFENLLDVWTHYGRQPTYQEIKQKPSGVGAKAYLSRWGSWTNALRAFVEKINETSTKHNEITENKIEDKKILKPKKIKELSEENRRNIKLGLRYDVLKRDSFKCVLCGISPAINPSTILHVDHIIPFSKGGKTEINNLRALCKDCNLGKSDKLENA